MLLQDEKQQILTTNVWLEQVNMTNAFKNTYIYAITSFFWGR